MPPISSSPELCAYAFDHLAQTLANSPSSPSRPPLPPSPPRTPVFVTWETSSSSQQRWDLRGCIGTLSPSDLTRSIPEYTLTSALRDRRFNPITAPELPSLRVSVSFLVNYEDCSNCYDWEVGVHGIIIHFVKGSREFSATYLPEVAKEHRMSKEEAVGSLVRKAGYEGKISADEISTRRYQSSKCTLTYAEWQAMR